MATLLNTEDDGPTLRMTRSELLFVNTCWALIGAGVALYAIIFITGAYLALILPDEVYYRHIYPATGIPLLVAGLLLFPAALAGFCGADVISARMKRRAGQ